MAEAPVLLLDVMDTLVHDPFGVEIPEFFGMSLAELRLRKHPSSWVEFERGEIDDAEGLARFFADGRSFDHRAFVAHVEGAYRWIDGMEDLVARLFARGVDMHVLSNYPVWYQWIERRLRPSRYIHWSFVSCRTGRRKPAPDAYLGAARSLGRGPRQCLFVDDRQQNCDGAEAIGMPSIRFADAATLAEDLVRRGLL
jgi:HAD superfamily hydrolase (TIGR01509 family)